MKINECTWCYGVGCRECGYRPALTITAILMLFVSIGCAHINPAFEAYLPEGMPTEGLTIEYGMVPVNEDMNITTIANCFNLSIGPTIVVGRVGWAQLNEIERRWLMRHEFGHCIEHLAHDRSIGPDGCPMSIMNPSIPKGQCLKQ